jgi:hypothetical protein
MALALRLDGVKLSDPDGNRVTFNVSVIDDSIADPKLQVIASSTISRDAFADTQSARLSVRNELLAWGSLVKANMASRDSFLNAFPVGTTIPVP